MGAHAVQSSPVPSTGSLLVRRPRASDAAGASLRKAFDGAPGISADLLRLLRALDKVD